VLVATFQSTVVKCSVNRRSVYVIRRCAMSDIIALMPMMLSNVGLRAFPVAGACVHVKACPHWQQSCRKRRQIVAEAIVADNGNYSCPKRQHFVAVFGDSSRPKRRHCCRFRRELVAVFGDNLSPFSATLFQCGQAFIVMSTVEYTRAARLLSSVSSSSSSSSVYYA